MGLFLGRAVRALMGAVVWAAVAVAMYALLRAVGSVGGPFDAMHEFASLFAALFKAGGILIGGGGMQGLRLLIPSLPAQGGLALLIAAVVRVVEILALAMVFAALTRFLALVFQELRFSRP
ncbi:MAG: hypothetical protein JO001_21965 [Alphaproteobacteria bacterium]|nr:hypothetical protein [Alphaproteobacteria bacterium]